MSSVEELLSVAEVDADTGSTIDSRIEIDADTRIIQMMPQDELFGVESDEKSERKYFKVPKIVGNGVDLSKLQLRINYQNASKIPSGKDMYIVTDATVYNDEWVYFSWELSRKVTQYKGTIYFIVCAVKSDSNGNITNEWNTTLAEGKVLEGLEVETNQEQQYQASDYLEQLKQQLLDYSEEIKDTFPSDYTQMQKDIGSLKGDLASAENGISLVHKNVLGNFLRNGTQSILVGEPFNDFIPDNTRVITNDIFLKAGEKCHIKASGFDKYIWFSSRDGKTIISVSGWIEASSIDEEWSYASSLGDMHTKFVFAKADDSALSVYEIDFKITGDKLFSGGLYERVNLLERGKTKKIPEQISINLSKNRETVIGTHLNYIIKCEDENGTNYLKFSNDLGKTWVKKENKYGNIKYIHFFLDCSILICGDEKCCVVSNDFSTMEKSAIYGLDGETFTPIDKNNFFSYDSPFIHIIDGTEVFAWGEYKLNGTSRGWYTVDGGKTIKCFFESGKTSIGDNVITFRHFHGVYYNKYNKNWYIVTGDTPSQCYIIKATYDVSLDKWEFEVVANGPQFKLTNWWFDEYYTYFCTDYTKETEYYKNKGIMRCPTSKLGDYSKYTLLYKAPQEEFGDIALSNVTIDNHGNKFLMPDFLGSGLFWFATDGWKFKKVKLTETDMEFGYWLGDNYNGDLYVTIYNRDFPFNANNLILNAPAVNLTKILRENGIIDFKKNEFTSEGLVH